MRLGRISQPVRMSLQQGQPTRKRNWSPVPDSSLLESTEQKYKHGCHSIYADTGCPKLHEQLLTTVKKTLNYGKDSSLWQTTERRTSCVKGFVLVKGSIARYIRPWRSLKRATRASLMKFAIMSLT